MFKFNEHFFNTNEKKTSSCSHLYQMSRYNHKRGNDMRDIIIFEINFGNGRIGRCSGYFRICHCRTKAEKGSNMQRTGILTQKLLLLLPILVVTFKTDVASKPKTSNTPQTIKFWQKQFFPIGLL